MDYGVALKKLHANPGRRSAHYKRQSPFEGSRRQVRGNILKALVRRTGLTSSALAREIGAEAGRVQEVLEELLGEGLVIRKGRRYSIP